MQCSDLDQHSLVAARLSCTLHEQLLARANCYLLARCPNALLPHAAKVAMTEICCMRCHLVIQGLTRACCYLHARHERCVLALQAGSSVILSSHGGCHGCVMLPVQIRNCACSGSALLGGICCGFVHLSLKVIDLLFQLVLNR